MTTGLRVREDAEGGRMTRSYVRGVCADAGIACNNAVIKIVPKAFIVPSRWPLRRRVYYTIGNRSLRSRLRNTGGLAVKLTVGQASLASAVGGLKSAAG